MSDQYLIGRLSQKRLLLYRYPKFESVIGVQTCALPIFSFVSISFWNFCFLRIPMTVVTNDSEITLAHRDQRT